MSTAPPIYYADLSDGQRVELLIWLRGYSVPFPDTDVRPFAEIVAEAVADAQRVLDKAEAGRRGLALAQAAYECAEAQGLACNANDFPAGKVLKTEEALRAAIKWAALAHVDLYENLREPVQGIMPLRQMGRGSGRMSWVVSEEHREGLKAMLGLGKHLSVASLGRGTKGRGNPDKKIDLSALDVAEKASRLAETRVYEFTGEEARGGSRALSKYPAAFLEDLRLYYKLGTVDPIRVRLDRAEWLTYERWGRAGKAFGRRVREAPRRRPLR